MLSQTAILKDDVAEIMAKVKESEVVVFATPIYYYERCGQMKTLLDRLNPLYESDYKFHDIYMLATAADDDAHAIDKAYNGLQGWVDCFEKAELKGYVFGNGIAEPGDTRNNFSYYDKSEPVCVVSRFAFSNNYFEKSAGLSNWNLSA